MAWRFRKSIKLGPLRLNLSKSGVGSSIGVRGFRVGQDAKGRSYTATSIPGTGIYERKYSSQGGAAVHAAPSVPGAPAGRNSGMGLAVLLLLLIFLAGGWVVSVLTPHPAPLPIVAPVVVTEPVIPSPAPPLKRRHGYRSAHNSTRTKLHVENLTNPQSSP